jgi:hypothetical protein
VETALAEALQLAARAQRWELVERIAAELAARRTAREEDDQRGASGRGRSKVR